MEEIVKLTKKQRKAIRKLEKREAKAQRLHELLLEYKLAARREAYEDIHEDNLDWLGDLEYERQLALKALESSNDALDGFAAAHPNVRPLETIHKQIIGDEDFYEN